MNKFEINILLYVLFVIHIPYKVNVIFLGKILGFSHFIMKKKFHYQFLVIYELFSFLLPEILSYPFLTKCETYKIRENGSFYKYLQTDIKQKNLLK